MKKIKFNGLVVNAMLSASLLTLASFTHATEGVAEPTQASPPSNQSKNTRVEHVYRNHPVDNNIQRSEDTYKKPPVDRQTSPAPSKQKLTKDEFSLLETSELLAADGVCGSWSTSGNALLNTIKTGGLSCIDSLFNSVPSGAFTEANIITVANEARYRAQIYDGVDTEEYLAALHYWIRAFYYQNNRANLTTANQAATKSAMDALFANSHFYDKTAAHAKLLDFAVPNVSGASVAEQYVTTVRNILSRYDQSFEDVPKWGSAFANISWNVLNECARQPSCRATKHTTGLVNELSNFIHNNISWLDHPERDYHLHNIAYQLAHMHSGKSDAHFANIKSTLEARVNRIFTDFSYLPDGTGRKAYMLAMSAVNYNQVCATYNLCSKKDEIIAVVLNDRIDCPSGTLTLWAQDMNQAQRNWTCNSLGSHETYFHSTMQTNNTPVVPDDNDKLRMVVFNNATEWSVYGGALFGASTDNGGLYLEGDPSKAGDQATFFAYEDVPARPTFDIWNLRHEYMHYLDGRFNTQGDFGDVNANGTGKTVWYGEGIAEFISRKNCNAEAATAAAESTYDISTIFGNEYGVGQTRIYSWGYLASRYMFEQQNATFFQMINKFREGDYSAYKSTMVDSWINNKTYDNGFKAWLPSVTSSGCTLDTTRPPSPIEPLNLEDVQGADQVGKNACFSGATREDNTLLAGEAVCLTDATNNGFVSLGIFVKSGIVADMQITLRNGSGNADMQHKAGEHPTDTSFDNSAAAVTGADETMLVKNVKAGWNYIRVLAKPSFSNVTMLARYLETTGGGGSNVVPTANANGPYSAAVNVGVAFSSNGSTDSDGSIASYRWNFGDGSEASTSANPNHTYTIAGIFTATLTVTDNDGATASSSAVVTVTGGSNVGYCSVTGGGTHEWIAGVAVGDLNNASAQDNYKLYNLTANLASGANTITLTPGFSSGTYTEHWAVWIDYNQDGDFTDVGEQVVSGLSGKTAVTSTISPPASAAGISTRMRVAMKYNQAVTTSCTNITSGEVEDYVVTIASSETSNNAPIAAINGPFSGAIGTGIAMSSNSSTDPDGTIVSHSWNFGDGTAVSTSANPNHAYTSAGTFTITLTVTDNDGATNSTTTVATISGAGNLAPTANANGPYNAAINTGIAFSSNGSADSDGSIASYSWNFGDGSAVNTSANPNHTYATVGNFTATLTVTDNEGATATSTAAVLVTGDQSVAYCNVTGAGTFEWISGVAVGGLNNISTQDNYKDYTNLTAALVSGANTITLTPGTTGNYTEHWGVWIDYNSDGDFTDTGEQVISGLSGTSAVTGSFTPPAFAAGKTTRMRIGMKYGQAVTAPCSNIASGEFEDYTVTIGGSGPVNKAPVAVTSGPFSGTAGFGVAMSSNNSSDSDGTITNRAWNFGDGSAVSTSTNPNHTYTSAGTFTITLTVTDNDGATHSVTTTATISAANTGGSIVNACSIEGPTRGGNLTSGDAICVPASTSNTGTQSYYILVPENTNSISIKAAHGTGNGDLYYNASTWASPTANTQSSVGATNSESIMVNNPAVGYRFISVVGARSGSTLLVELN